MKCPRCGQWNQASLPHCFRCGEVLQQRAEPGKMDWQEQFKKPQLQKQRVVYDDTTDPVEDLIEEPPQRRQRRREPLAQQMTSLKERRERGERYLQEFRENAAKQGITPSPSGVSVRRDGAPAAMPDDPAVTLGAPVEVWEDSSGPEEARMDDVIPPPARARAAALEARSYYQPADDPYQNYYDQDIPPSYDAPGPIMPAKKKKRFFRRVRGPMLVAYLLVAVLALGVLAFVGYVVASYVVPTLSTQRGGEQKLEDYFLETIEIDGLPGHRVRIAGEEGSQIYIAELMKPFVVVNGYATIEVADYVFYDTIEHLEVESMEVSLTPTLLRSGTETRMESIRYTIEIPASPLVMIQPEVDNVTVNSSKYHITLQVTPGSKVYVNGEDRSDTVSDQGIVTANPSVQAIGNNAINITVKAPYCRETNKQIILYREPIEIPLELHPATLMNTSDQRLTIYATTQVGAEIQIESPHYEMDTSMVDTDGTFWVAAKMGRVGNNTIIIRAKYEGKKDSVIEHVVYYLPPAEVYTPKAWALNASDYNELMNNIAYRMEIAQIYLCKGVIKEVLSESPQLAIMDTGTDGREQLVLLENQSSNHSDKSWIVGKTYRVYADVSGVYNNMPRLIGRYTYDP